MTYQRLSVSKKRLTLNLCDLVLIPNKTNDFCPTVIVYGQDKKANNNNVKTNQTNVASKQKTSLPPAKHLNSCTKSTKRQISTFVNYIYQNILYSAIASISPCLVISMCVQMYSGLLRDKDITLVKFNSTKILFYQYKIP